MNKTINVAVKNKIAKQTNDVIYICGNSDFIVNFDFDDEWLEHRFKTARFIYGGRYTDMVFEGNQCPVPVISDTYNIKVGVFAGDLRTSTPAHVGAKKSILCDGGSPAAPADDVYAQIMAQMNELIVRLEFLENGGSVNPPGGGGGTESNDLDVLIVAGQSNSVCYSGTNGASLDVAVPDGVFEYRPSLSKIQPFANPVGEAPSDAGGALGYSTGGTWFSSLAKKYVESTRRKLCIIPAGNPGVATATYYNGGSNFNMLMSKYNGLKAWFDSQDTYKIGRVMLVWHQGESGTGDGSSMKVATKKVFDDLKAAIPELDQIFYCRIAQNDACDNVATKNYNTQFVELNNETEYVLAGPNAMKYYWLNQFADIHHYDQYACNDFGAEIGANIAKYYANGGVKSDTKPFELQRGSYGFPGFTGVSITNNQLCYFEDSLDKSVYWALCSALYESYAEIEPFVFADTNETFDVTFNVNRGDKEGTHPSPVFGGSGSIMIDATRVIVSDGVNSITLNHNISPFIVRGGNITKATKNNVYRLLKNGGILELYVNGIMKNSKAIPSGFNASFNLLGKHNNLYLDGVITDVKVVSVAGEAVTPTVPFSYSDTVRNTVIANAPNINGNGDLVINENDTLVNCCTLNDYLTLSTNEAWKMRIEFTPTKMGIDPYFTLMGRTNIDAGLYAMQIGEGGLRVFVANNTTVYPINGSVDLNVRHTLDLECDGNHYLHATLDSNERTTFAVNASPLMNYDAVGQSIYNGLGMGHAGAIHSVSIFGVDAVAAVNYSDDLKNTSVASAPNVQPDGSLAIAVADTPADACLLDKALVLRDSERWTLTAEFTAETWGAGDTFALMGTANEDTWAGIYAMQITPAQFRLYMGNDFFVGHNYNLGLGVKHTVSLVSDGSGTLTVNIDSYAPVQFELPATHNGIAVNCKCVGQSFYGGASMGHAGTLHSLSVSSDVVSTTVNYSDTVKNTSVAFAPNAQADGSLSIAVSDTPADACLLDNALVLRDSERWTLTAEFTAETWGANDSFTLMGTANEDVGAGIYALQITRTQFRLYMGTDFFVGHNYNLEAGVKHTVSLVSDGSGTLTVNIDGYEPVTFELPATHNGIAVNCKCVGQSFYPGGNMGHAGTLHSLSVS